MPNISGSVETEFIWPTLLGEHVLPFRNQDPDLFVVPLTSQGTLLSGEHQRIDAYPGLADWTRRTEEIWRTRSTGKMTLTEQIDHMSKLTQQVPPPQLRVVYAKAGMHVSAAVVTNPRVIIDHTLYWSAVATLAEGRFLMGILNAPVLTALVRPLMSYGKDERHIDKHVWKLPIPTFDPGICQDGGSSDSPVGVLRVPG
ncbi:hypothetical protein [Ornithinimicrobium murale]|uniref:hypothetical protein n=1 Tax=Ornithinimicrobium murale TaxID=1050153 RepID=UPI000E0D7251|nr:hypothetical protein [Ornithinimicrobium murale]